VKSLSGVAREVAARCGPLGASRKRNPNSNQRNRGETLHEDILRLFAHWGLAILKAAGDRGGLLSRLNVLGELYEPKPRLLSILNDRRQCFHRVRPVSSRVMKYDDGAPLQTSGNRPLNVPFWRLVWVKRVS
jgi:hypothetical protein